MKSTNTNAPEAFRATDEIAVRSRHLRRSKDFIKGTLRALLSFTPSRRLLNALYLGLPNRSHARIHSLLARIFRQSPGPTFSGEWMVKFLDVTLRIPLRRETLWLDWETALSITGHDAEVKATYSALLRSELPPQVFVDVGGNYGTHSILFLAHGVNTITVEPNPTCHGFFSDLCAANNVSPTIEPIALGDGRGDVVLVFPTSEAWLGSVNATVSKTLSESRDVVSIVVQQRPLDDFQPRLAAGRTLIKIDAEGSELSILNGASSILRDLSPMVIFESWPDQKRSAIFEALMRQGYGIWTLPFDPARRSNQRPLSELIGSSCTNFIAVPQTSPPRGSAPESSRAIDPCWP